MRLISKKRTKGHMQGRGKYGITVTYKGKRGLANITFRTKRNAIEYLDTLKYSIEHGTVKGYKNPRIVKLK